MSQSNFWDYVNKFEVDPKKLNEEVSDVHPIAADITDWEVKLAGPLGLSKEDIDDIHDSTSNPKLKRIKVLQLWMNKAKATPGGATYGLLLEKFLQAKYFKPAETLCKLIPKGGPPSGMGGQYQQPGYQQPGACGYQQPGFQPGYQQPGFQPRYQQPGFQTGYQQPGYQQQPGFQQPGFQPGYQQPGFQPGYQQPGFQQTGFQPGYQQPGFQQTGYQQPGYHQQPGYQQPVPFQQGAGQQFVPSVQERMQAPGPPQPQGAAGQDPSVPNGKAATNGGSEPKPAFEVQQRDRNRLPQGWTDSSAQQNQVSPTATGSSGSPPATGSSGSPPELPLGFASTAAYSSDGGKIQFFEAESRGLKKPKLKLRDNDRDLTEIHPRPLEVFPPPKSGYYDMRAQLHGVAIIINNKNFKYSLDHGTRNGTERDEYNLHQTFKFLGYRLVIFTDLTSTEMMDLFNNLDHYLKETDGKSKNQVAHDSFICCILSHGGKGVIYGSDSKPVNREDIERAVGKSQTLLDKPKVFFIQACRGVGTAEAVSADSGSTADRSDMYICLATAVGDKAFRHNERGSWFVTEVCKILCEFGTCYKFPDDFQPQLNTNVAENKDYRIYDQRTKKEVVQQPVGAHQLKHSIHFFLQ